MKEDKAVMLRTVTGKQDINVGHFCAFSISVQSIMSREWCIYCSLRYYLFIVDDGNNPLTVTHSETTVGTDLHRAEMTQKQRGAKRRLNARQKAFNINYSLFVRCITAPPSQDCVKAISAQTVCLWDKSWTLYYKVSTVCEGKLDNSFLRGHKGGGSAAIDQFSRSSNRAVRSRGHSLHRSTGNSAPLLSNH